MKISSKLKYFWLVLGLIYLSCDDNGLDPLVFPNDMAKQLIRVYNTEIASEKIMVIGSNNMCFITAFKRTIEGEDLVFDAIQNEFPIVASDQFGRKWDVFGESEDSLISLECINSSFGFWFAWSAIFPGIELYNSLQIFPSLQETLNDEWSLAEDFVFTGAQFDAIDGLVYPEFIKYDRKQEIENGFYLKDDDIVIGVYSENGIRVYPHAILNHHEIINDSISGQQVAIIFSPFTGSTAIWNRNIGNKIQTFGSSGMIYNNNILPFDRNTLSIWSQLLGICVKGFYRDTRPVLLTYFETKWETMKQVSENLLVVSPDTGYEIDYTIYPYTDYRTNDDYLFFQQLQFEDNRLSKKERVFGLHINNEGIVYQLKDF